MKTDVTNPLEVHVFNENYMLAVVCQSDEEFPNLALFIGSVDLGLHFQVTKLYS